MAMPFTGEDHFVEQILLKSNHKHTHLRVPGFGEPPHKELKYQKLEVVMEAEESSEVAQSSLLGLRRIFWK